MSGSISYSGNFNPSQLQTPGLYLNVLTTGQGTILPANSGIVALEGVASWGPVNQATQYGASSNMALFGPPVNRTADLVSHTNAILQLQQASNTGTVLLNRVTDGTDAAATGIVGGSVSGATLGGTLTGYTAGATIAFSAPPAGGVQATGTVTGTGTLTAIVITNPGSGYLTAPTGTITGISGGTGATATATVTGTGLTLTSLHTGVFGNQTAAGVSPGSSSTTAAPTWKIVIQLPGLPAETFDNVGGAGNALWVNLAAAINSGQSAIRARSALVTAAAGAITTAPVTATFGMAGGTDGGMPSSAQFMGVDGGARTGIYTFRQSGASHLVVADFSDTTQSGTLTLFGQSEGILCHIVGPIGEASVATAAADKQTQGTSTVWVKRWMGDWCYWQDNSLGLQRLMSPATFGAGNWSTLPVQASNLNKPIANVAATQRSKTGNPYGPDELALLTTASIDVICNPIPAGYAFGERIGKVASPNGAINNDQYPILTSFLARSITGPGSTVGSLIGDDITSDFFTDGYALFDAYLSGLVASSTIQSYSITFGVGNNPQSQTAQGIVIASIAITYLGIATIFLVNMTAGSTVVSTPAIAA